MFSIDGGIDIIALSLQRVLTKPFVMSLSNHNGGIFCQISVGILRHATRTNGNLIPYLIVISRPIGQCPLITSPRINRTPRKDNLFNVILEVTGGD